MKIRLRRATYSRSLASAVLGQRVARNLAAAARLIAPVASPLVAVAVPVADRPGRRGVGRGRGGLLGLGLLDLVGDLIPVNDTAGVEPALVRELAGVLALAASVVDGGKGIVALGRALVARALVRRENHLPPVGLDVVGRDELASLEPVAEIAVESALASVGSAKRAGGDVAVVGGALGVGLGRRVDDLERTGAALEIDRALVGELVVFGCACRRGKEHPEVRNWLP